MFLQACATAEVHKRAMFINNGDSKQDVLKVMGRPENRQFRGNEEAWQWCETTFGHHNFTIVWLNEGKVTAVNTIGNSAAGEFCNSAYRTIRWEDAPSSVVEIRNR
jgi:hypothetical protein